MKLIVMNVVYDGGKGVKESNYKIFCGIVVIWVGFWKMIRCLLGS